MSEQRTKIAYLSNGFGNFSRSLFSSLAYAGYSAEINLWCSDKQKSLNEEVIANNIRAKNPNSKGDIIYISADSAEAALKNAGLVILEFNGLTPLEMSRSLEICSKNGVSPYSGNNAGAIFAVNACALLPEMLDIGARIRSICPKAFVVNISTPLAVSMLCLSEIFPKIKMIGCLDETDSTIETVAEILTANGIPNVKKRLIKRNLTGIPGFNFFTSLTYNGEDVLPIIKNAAENYFKSSNKTASNAAKFDFFLRYDVLPAVTDASLADFLPDWYKDSHITKISPSEPLDEYKRFNSLTKALRGGTVLPVGNFTETAYIIKALTGGGNLISEVAAVVRECGHTTVKKTNALISEKSCKSLESETLPPEVSIYTCRHRLNYKILLDALKQRDLDIAFNAFLNEPQMTLPIDTAAKCFTELLTAARQKLIYYLQ
ncbi:MAG: hypothetical protein LBM87_00015 [Ruminococcus sp.]|jgi:alpha-galactosidase|nr:hypothetical protein [Ruminococcus sp.]